MDQLSIDDCKKLLVPALKEILKCRNAPTSGKKAELVDRLSKILEKEAAEKLVATEVTESNTESVNEDENIVPQSKPLEILHQTKNDSSTSESSLIFNSIPPEPETKADEAPIAAQNQILDTETVALVEFPFESREESALTQAPADSMLVAEVETVETPFETAASSSVLIPPESTSANIQIHDAIVPIQVPFDSTSQIHTIQSDGGQQIQDTSVQMEVSTLLVTATTASIQSEPMVIRDDINELAIVTKTEQVIESETSDLKLPLLSEELRLKEVVKLNLKNKIPLIASRENAGTQHYESLRSKYIRIDNFQRPLHLKNLIQWLQTTLELPDLEEESVWLNSIKTHCYLQLPSEEVAELSIQRVSGQKFPSTNVKSLSADFTTVSPADAPQSLEAQMKPEEWKTSRGQSLLASPPTAAPSPRAAEATGVKRKAGDDIGGQMLKKAVEMATTAAAGRNTVVSNSNTNGAVAGKGVIAASTENASSSSIGFFTKKHKMEMGLLPPSDEMQISDQNHNGVVPAALSLDDLFKKTATTPCIYWLPVQPIVVEKRMKNRLRVKQGV